MGKSITIRFKKGKVVASGGRSDEERKEALEFAKAFRDKALAKRDEPNGAGEE